MSGAELAVATAAVAIGSVLQGSVGFGFGTFAAPLLAIVDRELVPGPMLFLALILTTLIAVREREDFDLGGVKWALAGRLPGTALGAAAVAVLPQRGLTIVFGITVLLSVGVSVVGWRVSATPPNLVVAGMASGIMGTATSIGGPPIALVYQDAPGARLRSTLSGFFVVGAGLSLLGLALSGSFGGDEMRASLLLVPPMVVGYVLSRAAGRVLDRGRTRTAVLVMSAGSALFLLADELL